MNEIGIPTRSQVIMELMLAVIVMSILWVLVARALGRRKEEK